jgi:hypothetical protein
MALAQGLGILQGQIDEDIQKLALNFDRLVCPEHCHWLESHFHYYVILKDLAAAPFWHFCFRPYFGRRESLDL